MPWAALASFVLLHGSASLPLPHLSPLKRGPTGHMQPRVLPAALCPVRLGSPAALPSMLSPCPGSHTKDLESFLWLQGPAHVNRCASPSEGLADGWGQLSRPWDASSSQGDRWAQVWGGTQDREMEAGAGRTVVESNKSIFELSLPHLHPLPHQACQRQIVRAGMP